MKRHADPRRQSFFDAPAALTEEKEQEVAVKKQRNGVDQANVTEVRVKDGFTFRRKQPHGKPGKTKGQENVNGNVPPVVQEEKQQKSKSRVSSRAKSKSKAADVRKSEVPSYPVTDFTAPTIPSDAPREVAVQRFFEHLMHIEMKATDRAFTGKYKFVADAVATIGEQFISSLKREYVLKSVQELQDLSDAKARAENKEIVVLKPNPTNADLATQLAAWQKASDKVNKEIAEWEKIKKQWTEFKQQSATSTEEMKQLDVEALCSAKDREFLQQNCAGVLSKAVPEAWRHVSVKSDQILTALRHVSESVENGKRFQEEIFDSVSPNALNPFRGGPDQTPRSLIRSMSMTAVSNSFNTMDNNSSSSSNNAMLSDSSSRSSSNNSSNNSEAMQL